ncbi:hypothetical protein CENSYa_0904 [Cenarchaeum symbiosum A]|uniref:Antitoxin SocA-like Panacea domain-containing protein n=1 Tax=Cenarchaeum symbiosum (strain A) TaxID=414004 RepID=A0RW19_CENSY|nr:hypothetical protein CENSYa_0904 [Cenarchaeum symbiosum A]
MDYKKINAQDAVLLIVHANNDELRGRTILQKLAYFWTLSISPIINVSFESHYYGPYSAEIRHALDITVAKSLMDESIRSEETYNRYCYKITEDSKDLVRTIAEEYKDEFKQISHIIATCKEFECLQYKELSHAVKAYYLYDKMAEKEKTKSAEVMVGKARSFGWSVEQKKIQNGIKLLEKLELI